MQRSHTEFVHELIKGKISEIVFQHLFSEHEFATVLPFGYEHTTPLLAQYQLQIPKETLENIRNTSDFHPPQAGSYRCGVCGREVPQNPPSPPRSGACQQG